MKRNRFIVLAILFFTFLMMPSFTAEAEAIPNPYDKLVIPTQITKIGDTYYIVDSYHNQILYSPSYNQASESWMVMASDLSQPHAIAGDNFVYLVADTENHRVVCYIKSGENYVKTQIFDNIGIRPHYIIYEEETGYFYVWSSMTGEMYLFQRNPDSFEVNLKKVIAIPEFAGKYIRSFTIEGSQIYFPCVESSSIFVADRETFKINAQYPVPHNIAGMVQLLRIQNYYYLTVSTDINYDKSFATIVRARTLEDFISGNYEDLNKKFGNSGTPYYISYFDDSYFTMVINENRPYGYKFDVINDKLSNMKMIFY